MKVESFECFTLSHRLSPRTGPSIAYSTTHAYVLVRLMDADGRVGWGETYRTPGVLATIDAVARGIVGRDESLRSLTREVRWKAGGLSGGGFATSALNLALEDLRGHQLGLSIAAMLGGPVRDRVRMYAASGGYIEGHRPGDTWFDEYDRIIEGGFTAAKLRIGGYEIGEEAPLLERLVQGSPPGFMWMADGNAAYTLKQAIRMGRVLQDLEFRWYEEPMEQRSGYVRYDLLASALDIEIAGGEALVTRTDARRLLERAAVDIVQPDPVISGGVVDALGIAELANLYGATAVPHTSNSAIGIAAALQVIACIADDTRSPTSLQPVLEYGVDDSPFRTAILAEPLLMSDGWVNVPSGPGLGIVIDESYVRGNAIERTEGAAS